MRHPHFLKPVILLHPIIPKPLHGLNPRFLRGQAWWDQQRFAAYARNNYCCWACGVDKAAAKYHQWLEGHECYVIDYAAGTAEMIVVAALCHACHAAIHSGKLEMDLEAGKITLDKHDQILAHKQRVLSDHADLLPATNPFILHPDKFANWQDWRLLIDGVRVKTRFANFEDWKKFYSGGSKSEQKN